MNGLTTGTLAEIIRGQLVLGTMPPLGGEWEPVSRVVFDSSQVRRGDIFWERLDGDGGSFINGMAEEAFSRGALGAISQRYVEPWAGACTIQVADAQHSLERLAHWVLVRSRRRRLLVLDSAQGELTRLLQLVVASPSPCQGLCATAEEVALCTISGGLQAGWEVVGVAGSTEEHLARISDLCAPRVAVITSAASGRMDLAALLDALPKAGRALVCDEDGQCAPFFQHVRNLLCVGTGAASDCRVLSVHQDGQQRTLAVGDQRVTLPVDERWSVNDLSLAVLAAHEMGISSERITAACHKILAGSAEPSARGATKNCKVPPSVLGLRESDAALPPGLKRWAC